MVDNSFSRLGNSGIGELLEFAPCTGTSVKSGCSSSHNLTCSNTEETKHQPSVNGKNLTAALKSPALQLLSAVKSLHSIVGFSTS